MLTFRVEHPETHEGPYNGPFWDGQTEMALAHGDWRHPTPNADPLLYGKMRRRVDLCGTDSPAALIAWFDGWWDYLAAAGYVVVIVKARRVHVGLHGQAIFSPYGSRTADRLDVDTFLGLFDETDPEDVAV